MADTVEMLRKIRDKLVLLRPLSDCGRIGSRDIDQAQMRGWFDAAIAELQSILASAPVERDPYPVIVTALMEHRLLYTQIDGDDEGLPLVDMLTPDGDTSIARGKEEIGLIADAVCDALEKASASQPAQVAPAAQEPRDADMQAVCRALGFDPTNHHNAAKCPYCRPTAAPPAPQPAARMLTEMEILQAKDNHSIRENADQSIIRKFCKVHGIPLADGGTEE